MARQKGIRQNARKSVTSRLLSSADSNRGNSRSVIYSLLSSPLTAFSTGRRFTTMNTDCLQLKELGIADRIMLWRRERTNVKFKIPFRVKITVQYTIIKIWYLLEAITAIALSATFPLSFFLSFHKHTHTRTNTHSHMEKVLEQVDIGGRIEIIQTTALLR